MSAERSLEEHPHFPSDEAPAITHSQPQRTWHFGALDVTLHPVVEGATVDAFWSIYEQAFGPLRAKAAARQFLTRAEFDEEMADDRVMKFVAWDDNRPVGLTTLTRDLSAIPWISPEFYAARYPEHAARNAIFYLGFVLVDPRLRSSRVFHRLMEVVTDLIAAESGVVGYDICGYNDATLLFSQRIESFVRRRHHSTFDSVDSQDYHVLHLPGSAGETS